MKVSNIIKKSFELWVSNLVIIVPFLIQLAFYLLLAVLFNMFIFNSPPSNLNIMTVEEFGKYIIGKIFQSYSTIAYLAVSVLAAIFVSCFILSGAIGMSNEICNKKKAKIKDMFIYGKKFWFPYFKVSLIIGFLMIFFLAIGTGLFLALAMFGLSTTVIDILTIIFALALMLLGFIFIPATTILVVEGTTALSAIKMSFKLSRNNYFSLAGLVLVLILINLVISFIPYIGQLMGFAIMNPVQSIAIVLFVTSRMQQLKKKK